MTADDDKGVGTKQKMSSDSQVRYIGDIRWDTPTAYRMIAMMMEEIKNALPRRSTRKVKPTRKALRLCVVSALRKVEGKRITPEGKYYLNILTTRRRT